MKCSPLVALVSSAALVAAHHHSTTADVRLEIPPLTTFTPKHHGDPTVIIYHTTRELVTHTSTATKRCLPSNKPSPEERDNFPIVETPVAKSSDITILTPENYSQTVHNPTQDIFVEYYAPWCGYCKAFEPTYAALATSMKKKCSLTDKSSTPIPLIARLNADAWKPPNWIVKGYPTLVLWPATTNKTGSAENGTSKKGIEYKGKREEKAMRDFLVEKAGC